MFMTRSAFLACLFLLSITCTASAQTPFYQSKTIRIVVGNLPGDTHDLFARAYARSMGKYIAGNPEIIVQNMPGAGTMIAANHVFNIAKPDGLTLGSLSPALYYAQLTGSKEVRVRLAEVYLDRFAGTQRPRLVHALGFALQDSRRYS